MLITTTDGDAPGLPHRDISRQRPVQKTATGSRSYGRRQTSRCIGTKATASPSNLNGRPEQLDFKKLSPPQQDFRTGGRNGNCRERREESRTNGTQFAWLDPPSGSTRLDYCFGLFSLTPFSILGPPFHISRKALAWGKGFRIGFKNSFSWRHAVRWLQDSLLAP
jgi:hypothetical protein